MPLTICATNNNAEPGRQIPGRKDSMTQEQIEMLQDAWFPLRDTFEETGNAEVRELMDRLHDLIDREMEKGTAA